MQMGFSFSVESWMQMWPDLINKAKEGGLDVIQTYVFWNGHEPSPGKVLIQIIKLSKYFKILTINLI